MVGTNLLEHLGIEFEHDGEEFEINYLHGEGVNFFSELDYYYAGGEDPHHAVDRINATTAELMFSCDEGYGRMALKDVTNYSTVASSFVIGALMDGDSLNLKAYLLSEIIDHFLSTYTGTPDNIYPELVSFGNYPNPFTGSTRIEYTLRKDALVRIDIFDASGQLIRQLLRKKLVKGVHSVHWDAKDNQNNDVREAIYYYRIIADDRISTGKMILFR